MALAGVTRRKVRVAAPGRLVAGPSIHMLAVGPEVAVVVVGRIRAGLQRAQRQLLLQGAGQGGNSAAMSLPGSPRLSWLIQSSNHGARLAHAPEQAGHARTACRSRYGSDRRRRRTGGRARAALPCRRPPIRAAKRREKARTPGRRPRRHTGSTPRIGAHALVVLAMQMPISPAETVRAVADQRIGDAGFLGAASSVMPEAPRLADAGQSSNAAADRGADFSHRRNAGALMWISATMKSGSAIASRSSADERVVGLTAWHMLAGVWVGQAGWASCARAAMRGPKKKPLTSQGLSILAERVGFEPTVRGYRTPDFESGTFDHSATSPWLGSVTAVALVLLFPFPTQASGLKRG